MKKFVAPAFSVLPVAMKENIASSQGDTTVNVCPLGIDSYSANKQECQNCKLYFLNKGTIPAVDVKGGIMTFCENNNLPYTDKDQALAAVADKSCPAGLG